MNDSSSCLVCSGWSIAGDKITDDWLTALGVVGMSSRNIVFALFSFPSCPKRVCLIHYTGLYTLHTFCLKTVACTLSSVAEIQPSKFPTKLSNFRQTPPFALEKAVFSPFIGCVLDLHSTTQVVSRLNATILGKSCVV